MKRFLIILCAILGIVISIQFGMIKDLRVERSRLSQNQESLLKDVEVYKTKAGESAASCIRLQLTYDELKDSYADLTKTADDLRIKIKRIQATSEAATQTELNIQPVVRDSVVYRDTTFLKVKAISWHDQWVSVKGSLYPDDKLDLMIFSRDTLTQIIHRVPKRFLFFRWGIKAIRQEIVSSNPHTNIVYSKYIELIR